MRSSVGQFQSVVGQPSDGFARSDAIERRGSLFFHRGQSQAVCYRQISPIRALFVPDLPDDTARIACREYPVGNVARNHAAGADYRP